MRPKGEKRVDPAHPPSPPTVESSTEPVFLYEGLRHLLGYHVGGGHDVYAIWDRETGDARSFPLTDDGWRQAWLEFSNLEATAIPGVRVSPWKARRPRAGVLAVLGALGTIAVLALFRVVLPRLGPDATQGVVIFQEDFTDPTGFPAGEGTGTREGPVDGTYQLLFKRAATTYQGGTTDPITAIRVEADVTVVETPGPSLAGVACVTGSGGGASFFFLISPRDGVYSISRGSRGESVIAADRRPGLVRASPGATNHVAGHCTGSVAGGPAKLVMLVNGQKVLETEAPGAFTKFNVFLIAGTASEGGTDIRFDNLVVRRY